VFRPSSSGPLFLVVQAHGAKDQWVLPKGHVEAGETPEDAALREVREEAGVEAALAGLVGESKFVAPRGPVHARFYLMRHQRDVAREEDRAVAWLPFLEARSRLTFADQRGLLDRAQRLLVGGSRSGDPPR